LVSSNTRSKKKKNISESEFETVLNNELNKNFTDENNIESPTYESFDEPTLPSNDDFSSNEEPPPLNNFSLTSNKLLHHFLNQKLYHKPPNLNIDHNNFTQSSTKPIHRLRKKSSWVWAYFVEKNNKYKCTVITI